MRNAALMRSWESLISSRSVVSARHPETVHTTFLHLLYFERSVHALFLVDDRYM